MKIPTLSALLLVSALAQSPLAGGPMQIEDVPAQSKWVAHLNMEAIRDSKVGQYALREIVGKRLPRQEGMNFDYVAATQLINSVTVYGEEIDLENPEAISESGLAVIDGQPQLGAMVQGYLAYLALEGQTKLLQESPFQIVQLQDGTIGALLSDQRVVISRSRQVIERFLATQAGSNPNMRTARSFSGLGVTDLNAAVVVMAGGLGSLDRGGPEARVLKLSKGLALRLAEQGDDLALRVTLETNSSENGLRVQQILQGLLAIASFTQMDDQNLSTLLRSTVVRGADRLVHLEVAFPSMRVIEMLEAELPPIDIADDATGGDQLVVRASRSSADAVCCPENLADEDPRTGWQAEGTALSATLELESQIGLESIEIEWAEGIGKSFGFTLSTSTDGKTWKRRIVWDGGGTPPDSVAMAAVRTRFLKFEMQRPEAGVLGLDHLLLNGRLPRFTGVTASSDGESLPANLFDGDRNTSFDLPGAPVWVEGKLAGEAEIREVGLLWGADGVKELQILASADGIEWKRILALAQPVASDGFQRYNVRDVRARYVKLVAPDRSRWGQPREVRFYGEAQ